MNQNSILVQNEMHYVSEKLTIDIEIQSIADGFVIKYDNGRAKDEKFTITLDKPLFISILKEFEQKSIEFIQIEELNILNVVFDFFRNNTLYFDVFFENKASKKSHHCRMHVFYKSNNHGNIGEIYSLEIFDNSIS